MTAERWERLKQIFAEALEKRSDERDQFVLQALEGDAELLQEARRLLANHDDAESFLSDPALGGFAPRGEAPPLFAPEQVVAGRFRIVRFIARGGMGEVYEAEDLALATRVALKTIQAHIGGDRALELFKQEVLSARRVTHPNVCRIYDIAEHVSEDAGPPVTLLTMELLEGPTLSRYLKEHGPFSGREALPLVEQICAGLQAAHDAGVIHRDFKSGNVILTPGTNGLRPVITDFGLARAAGSGPEKHPRGTPGYMAPEQLEGSAATPATDVYALGVVIGRMIAGQKAPLRWKRTLERCAQEDPALRYQSPLEVAAALRSSSTISRWGVMTAGAVVALLAVFWLAEKSRPDTSAAPAVRIADPAPLPSIETARPAAEVEKSAPFRRIDVTRLTTIGRVAMGAISPDGKFVAFVRTDASQQSLWVKQLSTGTDVQVIPPRETVYFELSFSPDSQLVRYGEGGAIGTLYEIPILGGAARKLIDGVPRGTFSPDGRRYAFTRLSRGTNSELVVATLDGSAPKTIASRQPPLRFGALGWSPDGKTIVGLEGGLPAGSRIVWISPEGAPERTTMSTWREVSSIAWLPDGSGLIVNAQEPQSNESQIWGISYPRGDTHRITHDVNNYWGNVSLSRDGRTAVVAQRESDSNVWVTSEGNPSNAVRTTSDRSLHDGGVAWMPNGSLVFSASRRTPAGELAYDLWLAQRDGSNARILMADGINLHPRPCPDGKTIVFHHTAGTSGADQTGVWRMDLATGSSRQLAPAGNFPDCSATGWVVYTIGGGRSLGVWRVSIEGGEIVQLTAERASSPVISPDGATVAYSYGWGFAELSIDGTRRPRKHDGQVESIRWAPDGRAVVGLRTQNRAISAWSLPLDDSPPQLLTHFQAGGISLTGWDWSSSGLAYVQTTDSYDLVLIRDAR